jgi:hypothetical protein
MPRTPVLVLACAAALLAPAARAEPAVVSLAREYLGPESTLDAITSIHYVGSLERAESGQPAIRTQLDMIFAKPLRQRQVVRDAKTTMTTVLDGYEGWDWLQDNADVSKFRLTFLTVEEIKTLRANTWENLNHYRIPEWGRVEDMGPATADGIACERVDFTHDTGTVYERYFDRDTGRLVKTVRGPETFRESGEIRVDGLRFPKSIVSVTRTPAGKEIVSTAVFDSVTLNEKLSPDLFSVPSLLPAKGAAVVPGK